MKKLSAVLLFVALLAAGVVRGAGPTSDDDMGFLKRIATYLNLRQPDPAPTAATAPRAGSPRTAALGPPPGACTCVKGANVIAGEWVWDESRQDWICRSINNRAPDRNP